MLLTMRSAVVTCVVALGCGGSAAVPAGSGAPDAGVTAGGCPLEGWCWVSPLPQGNELDDVWSDASGEVWAVGGGGTRRPLGPGQGPAAVWPISTSRIRVSARRRMGMVSVRVRFSSGSSA